MAMATLQEYGGYREGAGGMLLKHTSEGRKKRRKEKKEGKEGREGGREIRKEKGILWSCFFRVPPFTNALLLKWSLTLQDVRAESPNSRAEQMLTPSKNTPPCPSCLWCHGTGRSITKAGHCTQGEPWQPWLMADPRQAASP